MYFIKGVFFVNGRLTKHLKLDCRRSGSEIGKNRGGEKLTETLFYCDHQMGVELIGQTTGEQETNLFYFHVAPCSDSLP